MRRVGGRAGGVAAAAILLVAACTRTTVLVDPRAAGSGRYSSAPISPGWPIWPPHFLLVVMSSAQYEVAHYRHDVNDARLSVDATSPTGYALLSGEEGTAIERTSESVGGTGVVVGTEGTTALVLTSYHVVDFPETLLLEVSSPLLSSGRLLIGRGRRMSQSTVVGRPTEGQSQARIVAFSRDADLALLRADLRQMDPYIAAVPYRLGESDALEPGDGAYVVGAPEGKFQITWGVVTPEGPTLLRLDTSTPAGYSGGAVLATNRESGELELVGIVRGTAGTSRNVWEFDDSVVPGMRLAEADLSNVVASTIKTRSFGITYCTPVARVQAFLSRALDVAGRAGSFAPVNLDERRH